MPSWLQSFIKAHVVADVPPQSARCNFECEKPHCTRSTYLTCAQRIAYAQAYEAELQSSGKTLPG